MSDLIDLIGVLGGLDEYLVEHRELVPEVSELLCPYQYDALGWFHEFRTWVEERPEFHEESPRIPGLNEALERLGETSDDEGFEPDLGLRLLALTVLARTIDRYGPDGEDAHLVVDALAVAGLCGRDTNQAHELLRLLTDSARFPDASTWDEMLHVALADGLIEPEAVQPLRCRGSVVGVDVAGMPHEATAVTTQLIDTHLDFDEATAFLDPGEWPKCCPAWCAMKRASDNGDGTERYEEQIGIACPNVLLTTCLGFRRVSTPDNRLAVLAYRLSPPSPNDCRSDGEVLVDEGSIEVRDRHPLPGIEITTTKRVLFRSVPPGPLAMFTCVLGYADLGDLLIYECARLHPGISHKKKWRAKAFSTPPATQTGGTGSGGTGTGGDGTGDGSDVFGDVAAAAQQCLDDAASGYRTSMQKLADGDYTYQDAGSDLAAMLKRGASDLATVIELGARAAGFTTPSQPPPGQPPPDQPPPARRP
jgi:hypothetical protein